MAVSRFQGRRLPELSRLNQRKINFVTIRRRGPAILAAVEQGAQASSGKGR